MKYHHNKYTNQLIIIALSCVIVIMLLTDCNGCRGGNVKVEPVIIKVKDSSTTKPKIDTIFYPEPGRIPELAKSKPFIVTKTDTLWIFEVGAVDTTEILKDYFAKVVYKDTLVTKYGNIQVWDTVTRNRIEGRTFLVDLSIPSVTKYVTTTVEPKKRNEVYFSMGGLYNNSALSVGGGLMLKTKRDRVYNANAYLGTDGQITYNFQTAFKFSLRKK